MNRLVIALTTLLTLVAGAVIAGYLFIFAAQPDRTAEAVPSTSSLYATIYLQPSTGQKLNLAGLLGRVPGFADAASLDQKIHEISARLLGEAGLDYEEDIRPWLGNQISLAVQPEGIDPEAADLLVVIGVKDRAAAAEALNSLASDLRLSGRSEEHQGAAITVADGTSWSLLDDLLLVGSSEEVIRAGLDAEADRTESLADSSDFRQAMERLPADHLGSIYVDLAGLSTASGMDDQLGGYRTASMALVVEQDGLRLAGTAPFDAEAAPSPAREAFALASEPSSLAEWMPADTQVEAVVFGLSQTLRAAEQELGSQDPTGEIASAINQIRALAALGLGISIDEDLLPLFDREAGIAVSGLESGAPHGQLLLRPSDPDGAAAGLARLSDALADRGAARDEREVDGTTITTLAIPDLGSVAFALRDGVVILGLSEEDVTAALEAHADGRSLAESAAYRGAWEMAGTRGGNELWLDAAALLDATGDDLGVTGEARDILLQVGSIAMTAPASDEQLEIHLVARVR